MATLNQLSKTLNSGTKRGKLSYLIDVDKITIREGLNIRHRIYPEQVEYFAASYSAGKYVPAIVVRVLEDETIEVLEGHHRLLGARQAISSGAEFKAIDCLEFEGSEADAILLQIKSAGGIPLTPLDRGEGYLRLSRLGKKTHEIAAEAQRSESDVIIHLNLMECTDYVKSLVSESKINYSYAVELTREHGVNEVDNFIKNQLETAQKKGKSKLTKGNSGEIVVTTKHLRRFIELISQATFKMKDDKAQFVLDATLSKEVADILNIYKSQNTGE